MKKLIPNLIADIIPKKSSAGFRLGLRLEDFLYSIEYCVISEDQISEVENKGWSVYYQDYKSPFDWDENHYHDIFVYWGGSLVLQFDGDTTFNPLKLITVGGDYQGKFNNIIGVGEAISTFTKEYDFLFYQDCFYLATKKELEYDINKSLEDSKYHQNFEENVKLNNNDSWEERNIIEGISIVTNYRSSYSIDLHDHMIESISIFM